MLNSKTIRSNSSGISIGSGKCLASVIHSFSLPEEQVRIFKLISALIVCVSLCMKDWARKLLHPQWIWTWSLVQRQSVVTGFLEVRGRLIQKSASWRPQWCQWQIRLGTAPVLSGLERFVVMKAPWNKSVFWSSRRTEIFECTCSNQARFLSNRSWRTQSSSQCLKSLSHPLLTSSPLSLRVSLCHMRSWKSWKLQQQQSARKTYP